MLVVFDVDQDVVSDLVLEDAGSFVLRRNVGAKAVGIEGG